jgi:hypothetical protein
MFVQVSAIDYTLAARRVSKAIDFLENYNVLTQEQVTRAT